MAQGSLADRDRHVQELSIQLLACLQASAARCQNKALTCWLSTAKLVSPLPEEQLPVLFPELNLQGQGWCPRCCNSCSAAFSPQQVTSLQAGSALLNTGAAEGASDPSA